MGGGSKCRIPLIDTTTSKINENNYLFQLTRKIQPQESLNNLKDKIEEDIPAIDNSEYLVIYNPDKWEYDVFYFLSDVSNLEEMSGVMYTILHISHDNLPN